MANEAKTMNLKCGIKEFKKIGAEKVFDKTRTVFVPDHFVPNKDIKSAEQAKYMREFVKEQDITNYFEVGRMGIEHALLPDSGIVCSGDLILGADSHTCTYGAIGAFSTGVGSTDLACAMASGETWLKVPPTIKVEFNGKIIGNYGPYIQSERKEIYHACSGRGNRPVD